MGLSLLRPKRFLVFFDLQFGVELILLCTLVNKVSGIYGVLAVFTGAEISALQLSMYIYSMIFTVALALWYPQVQKQNPLGVLTFAYGYLLDSLCNALYTVIFGASWFLVTSGHYYSALGTSSNAKNSHSNNNNNNKNLTLIANSTVSEVIEKSQETMVSTPSSTTATLSGSVVLAPESITSITIISALWVIRIYFCLVVLAFTKKVLRKSNAFSESNSWQDRLGRVLVNIHRSYWEGKGDDFGLGGGRGRKWRDSSEFEGLNGVEDGVGGRTKLGRSGESH